ncbi:hypothetical protein K458DRAFT_487347 [Lentithecium fluviatile CBS 122367]|uniref:Uncharacterized protein n=1 Tax=Lentithecium fluviatile CBS 122367 TaxID=1168545 RepID=A0A6G1J2N6_9PLEO|nr:hypothetical protein K458DRAFT_487347 [Lentithecium fluviatile CBS 122367]
MGLVLKADIVLDALGATKGFAPLLQFSSDLQRLYTVSMHLGKAVHSMKVAIGIYHGHLTLDKFRDFASDCNIPLRIFLKAMLGASNPYAPAEDFEKLLATLRKAVGSEEENALAAGVSDSGDGSGQSRLLSALRYSSGNYLFVTDTNLVSLSNEDPMPFSDGDEESCILVGLFGINFPFVLKAKSDQEETVCERVYEMVSVAHVADHRRGH